MDSFKWVHNLLPELFKPGQTFAPVYVVESVAELGLTALDALEVAAVRGCVSEFALDGRRRVVPAAADMPPSFSARKLARRFVADEDAAGVKELAEFATSA